MNKRIRTGLLAAAMVGGGLVGATQLVGNVSAESYNDSPATESTVEPTTAEVQSLVAQVDDTETPAPDGAEEGEGCHRGGHRGGRGFDAAAETIGIEVDELREGVESGLTLAQIAEQNGVSAQSVIDAMVEDLAQHLEDEVAAGDLTQDEAAERLLESVDRITTEVNEGRPDRPAPADAEAG